MEFSPWASIRDRYPDGLRDIVGGGPFDWPAGHATDDTDLTRAVLLAYLEPGDDVVRTAADHMVAWLRGDWPDREPGVPPRDIGAATAAGLRRYLQTGDPYAAGAGPGRAGNGSLMRCLPTALAVADRERRIAESMRISAITHDDERCTVACAAYNEIAAALLDGRQPDESVVIGRTTAEELGVPAVADAIEYGRELEPAAMARTGRDLAARRRLAATCSTRSASPSPPYSTRGRCPTSWSTSSASATTPTPTPRSPAGCSVCATVLTRSPTRWLRTLQYRDEFSAAARSPGLNGLTG